MEFKFLCDKKECQNSLFYKIDSIKKQRHIPTDFFDIYDLDKPIIYKNGIKEFERVCRICGNPLFNKNGEYSYHKRYCNNHNGSELWAKYNWGTVSKNYAIDISNQNKRIISDKFKEILVKYHQHYEKHPKKIKYDLANLTLCEKCGKLCYIYMNWYKKKIFDIINIHHIKPIHKLSLEELHLIWDKDNLIALCPSCHHSQDHQLKIKT